MRIGGSKTNAFTIRISSELLVWDTRYMEAAKTLATAVAGVFGKKQMDRMASPESMEACLEAVKKQHNEQ